MLISMEEDYKKNFFIVNEKDGSFSAYIRFGGFPTKDDAQFVIDTILAELGLAKTELILPTLH